MRINFPGLIILRLLIAFSILYFIYSKFPLSDVLNVLSYANLSLIGICTILPFIMYTFASYRLWQLTSNQGIKLSYLKIIEINLATTFYGLFLPGGNMAGGAVRVYKISGEDKRVVETLASIALDRIVATLALCIVGVFFWTVHRPNNSGFIGLIMLIGIFVIVFLQVVVFSNSFPHRLKLSFLNNLSFITSRIQKLYKTLNNYRNLSVRTFIFILVISIISQLVGIVAYYLLALSIGIDISYTAIGWVRSAVILTTMIPISISGLGLREGALLFLLQSYAVSTDETLAFSILIYLVTILTVGILGGLIEVIRFLIPVKDQI